MYDVYSIGQSVDFKLQFQQQTSMRVHKVKTKTVSSYLLSGINIKKMIADESQLAQDIPNISDATIIKINKRPIFKIIKDKEEETAELPNKTFKIRSFTRKLRRNGEQTLQENNEMFEKVQKLRHLKSVNNRIELFNLCAISKLQKKEVKDNQKTENSEKEYSKMRQILINNTEKWRASSQIIIKQLIEQPPSTHHLKCKNPTFQYTQIDTQEYRELAAKISYKINNEFKQTQQHSTLLVIAVDSLQVNQRRVVKSSKIASQEQTKLQKYRGKFGPQLFEALKLFTNKQHPFSSINPAVKIAFKVNNPQELEQLRQKLYLHQIDDYYCIFYINRKYSQIYNLYQLTPIFHNIQQLILVQHKYTLSHQFPVIPNTNSILIATHHETLSTTRKLFTAIKSFLICEASSDDEQNILQREQNSMIFTSSCEYRQEYQIKYEDIPINTSELQARLRFALQSRNIKNRVLFKNQKQERHHRRSALDDKTYSINNISQSMNLQYQKKESPAIKASLDVVHQRLLSQIQMRQQDNPLKVITSKGVSTSHKGQLIDDITYSIRHGPTKSKPLNIQIGDLLRRNEHIFKQVSTYLQKTNTLDHRSFNPKEKHFPIVQRPLESLRCIKII